jgi:hypothetical protein
MKGGELIAAGALQIADQVLRAVPWIDAICRGSIHHRQLISLSGSPH